MSDLESPAFPAPRDNPDLVGHQAAETAFREAFESGRLAHAWLICGPQGIGKATLAFRVARWVLAQGAGEAQSGPGLFDDCRRERARRLWTWTRRIWCFAGWLRADTPT